MNYFWINSKINRMNHIKACHEKTVLWQCWTSVSFCKLKHATYHIYIYPYIVDVSRVCHGIWAVPNTDTSRWALLERIKLKRLTRDDAVLELVSWKSHLNLLSLDGATLVFGMDKNGSFLQLGIAGTSFDGFSIPFDRCSALSNFLAQPLVTATCKPKRRPLCFFPCFDLNPMV